MTTRNNEQANGQHKATRGLHLAALVAMGATLLVGGCTVYEDNHYRGRPHYNYGHGHGHGHGFHDRHDDRRDWDRRGGWDDRRRR